MNKICRHCKKGYVYICQNKSYFGNGLELCNNPNCMEEHSPEVDFNGSISSHELTQRINKIYNRRIGFGRPESANSTLSQNSTDKEVEYLLKANALPDQKFETKDEHYGGCGLSRNTFAQNGHYINHNQQSNSPFDGTIDEELLENVWNSSMAQLTVAEPLNFLDNLPSSWIEELGQIPIAIPTPKKASVAFSVHSPTKGSSNLVPSNSSAFLQVVAHNNANSYHTSTGDVHSPISYTASEDSGFNEGDIIKVSNTCDSHSNVITQCTESVADFTSNNQTTSTLFSSSYNTNLDDKQLLSWGISSCSPKREYKYESELSLLEQLTNNQIVSEDSQDAKANDVIIVPPDKDHLYETMMQDICIENKPICTNSEFSDWINSNMEMLEKSELASLKTINDSAAGTLDTNHYHSPIIASAHEDVDHLKKMPKPSNNDNFSLPLRDCPISYLEESEKYHGEPSSCNISFFGCLADHTDLMGSKETPSNGQISSLIAEVYVKSECPLSSGLIDAKENPLEFLPPCQQAEDNKEALLELIASLKPSTDTKQNATNRSVAPSATAEINCGPISTIPVEDLPLECYTEKCRSIDTDELSDEGQMVFDYSISETNCNDCLPNKLYGNQLQLQIGIKNEIDNYNPSFIPISNLDSESGVAQSDIQTSNRLKTSPSCAGKSKNNQKLKTYTHKHSKRPKIKPIIPSCAKTFTNTNHIDIIKGNSPTATLDINPISFDNNSEFGSFS